MANRIASMMAEVDAYKQQALQDTMVVRSAYLQARLEDKANSLDQLWHDLAAAQTTLSWYLR